jgi:hemolysin activation/secretion protein
MIALTPARWLRATLVAFAMALPPSAVLAQPALPPDPAAVLQENQRALERLRPESRPQPETQLPISDTVARPAARPLAQAEGQGFLLTRVTFTPSVFLSDKDLAAAVAPFVGTRVDTARLQALIGAVNALYDARGLVTGAAIVPRQDLAGGVLQVRLVEGRLGAVSVAGAAYTSEKHLAGRLPLRPGEVLDLPALDRDILWFNRTSDIRIQGALRPGGKPGFTDLDLAVVEPPRNALTLFVDNQGNETTNEDQVGLVARRAKLFFDGDKAMVFATASRGSAQGSLSYDLPINRRGDRLAFSLARSDIEIVEGPFEPLGITGVSDTATLTWHRTAIADANWLVGFDATAAAATSTTDQAGRTFSDDQALKAAAGLSVTHIGLRNVVTLAQTLTAVESDGNVGRLRRFVIYNGAFSGQHELGRGLRLEGQAAWQVVDEDHLPPLLLLQIGGPTTVRGFATGQMGVSSGAYASLELHRTTELAGAGAFDAFGFVDHGVALRGLQDGQAITSAGVGASWRTPWGVTAEIAAARPIRGGGLTPDAYRIYARLLVDVF